MLPYFGGGKGRTMDLQRAFLLSAAKKKNSSGPAFSPGPSSLPSINKQKRQIRSTRWQHRSGRNIYTKGRKFCYTKIIKYTILHDSFSGLIALPLPSKSIIAIGGGCPLAACFQKKRHNVSPSWPVCSLLLPITIRPAARTVIILLISIPTIPSTAPPLHP